MNVAMLLEMAADGLGDRVAIGGPNDGLTFTALREHAVTAAERVRGTNATTLALLEPNGPMVPVALFGSAWAGCSYAPMNYRLPGDAIEQLLARLQPAVIATSDEWLGSSGTATARSEYPPEPEHPAVLLFTSGTSAAPKAAVLGHDHLTSYVFTTAEFGSAGEDEVNLLAAPPFHVAGVVAVLTSTYTGRRVVPLPSFTPEAWIEIARHERVTHGFLVPTMLARIVDVMENDPDARVPSLRRLTYGGARMPTSVLERALTLFPEAGFVNAYGLTETSSTVCILGPEDHREAFESSDPAIRRRLESAGRPIPGIEVRIDCAGEAAAPGQPGEILLRGEQVSGEYVASDSKHDEGGWLRTGDLGYVDDDGYLFVVGRADDMIIRGGENLSPTEIEDVLLQHPGVAAAAVVGLPDAEWGERVAAMIVWRSRAAAPAVDDLRAWARERLGSLKTPEVLVACDELPITATGKVVHRDVRATLESLSKTSP
jgi:acyl-CoA synthetase (AMP-forming)/AMP-acid ligase II